AYFTGLILTLVSRRGSGDAARWMHAVFRHQHHEKFLSSFEKLGLSGMPHAVACAAYHYLSNSIGGVGVEFMKESDRKAWVRFVPPRWIYMGAAICGVPSEVSRGFLTGWYAQNGVSLKNPRLGFVCTAQTVDGQHGLAGYFMEYDHDLAPEERLIFRPGEMPPPFDPDAMEIEVDLLLDWYVPAVTGAPAGEELRAGYHREWRALFARLEGGETTLMQRDFHSPNIIWRGQRSGFGRLGIIDFQDALIGPPAYDVASLAFDARVTVPPAIEQATAEAYIAARHAAGPFDEQSFREAYAIMATQRNSKILGIFVRLDRRDGKPGYLKHLPRIRDYLRRALAHPSLAGLRALYEAHGLLEERTL
ncbi:MAG: phosphotransferase, partial [Rhizobiales bacterium]|nr:phosphotransferase [Hyphomicrobiales bacterium]